jgi:hypothetical protein
MHLSERRFGGRRKGSAAAIPCLRAPR